MSRHDARAVLRVVPELLDDEPGRRPGARRHRRGLPRPPDRARLADRIINVGIREQLLIGVAGGLALTGVRPIVHTFAPFLLERPFEQVKLDLDHQDVGAVLVSAGGSYDWPGGETHFGRRDVALLDTLDGWTVHVPGHPDEAEALLRAATLRRPAGSTCGSATTATRAAPTCRRPRLHVVRRGAPPAAAVVAVGPMLDRVLAATEGRDVTVRTPRPCGRSTARRCAPPPAPDRRPRRAVPGGDVGRRGRRGAARPPAPDPRARRRPGRAAAATARRPSTTGPTGWTPAGIRRSIDAFLGLTAPSTPRLRECTDMTSRQRPWARRCWTTPRRLRLDPVPLDGPRTLDELEPGRRRPDQRGGHRRRGGARAVRRGAGAGVHLHRPPALPVVHPGAPTEASRCSTSWSGPRRSTAAPGSRAPARSSPRTRRCAGSPTSSGCPSGGRGLRAGRHDGQPLRAGRRPARRPGRRGGDRPARWGVAGTAQAHSSITRPARSWTSTSSACRSTSTAG